MALSAAVAVIALDPAIPAAYAAHRAEQQRGKAGKGRKRKPPARRASGRKGKTAGSARIPLTRGLTLAFAGIPGMFRAPRGGRGREGTQRRESGGEKKVHLLAAVTHVPGLVIAQDKVPRRQGERDQPLRPLLAPLPLDDVWSPPTRCRRTGATPCSSAGPRPRITCGRPGQPAGPERAAERHGLGEHARRRRAARPSAAGSRPHRPRPPGAAAPGSKTPPRPCSSNGTSRTRRRAMADQGRVRPLPDQPHRGPDQARGPARPRPRPLAGGAHPLARRDLERRHHL